MMTGLFSMEPIFRPIVECAIDGDMDALAQLVAAPWPDVAAVLTQHSFIVTPGPVADVLRRLQRGDITGAQAQG